ncbi:MAG: hypothetical protein CSA39_01410, partial [Flavobacteriales bacterium]
MKTIFSIISSYFFCFLFVFPSYAQQNINQVDADGNRHGLWKKYYKNNRIRYEGTFNHGKESGTFKFYSAANSEFPITIKKYGNNSDVAEVTFFTETGVLQSKGKMQGKNRIGKWLFYHEDGKTIMAEENYTNGLLDGEYKTFYNTGKPTEIAYYKNG